MKTCLLKAMLALLLIGYGVENVNAQIPSPIRYYSLDNGSAKESINRKDGTIHGKTGAV